VTDAAADRLARSGLLFTAAGALLLLYTPWAKFWQWANFVGSLVGVVLTVWGIVCLYRAIAATAGGTEPQNPRDKADMTDEVLPAAKPEEVRRKMLPHR
jgi:hypothetical protein